MEYLDEALDEAEVNVLVRSGAFLAARMYLAAFIEHVSVRSRVLLATTLHPAVIIEPKFLTLFQLWNEERSNDLEKFHW